LPSPAKRAPAYNRFLAAAIAATRNDKGRKDGEVRVCGAQLSTSLRAGLSNSTKAGAASVVMVAVMQGQPSFCIVIMVFMLTEEDKQWIVERLEKVETTLLTEFHKWASPLEMRQKSHAAALRALDTEAESLSDRLKNLEGQ
jgi:hypothetical protein